MHSVLNSFSIAELSALKLDGELSQSHQFHDEADTWKERSHRILSHLTYPTVLTGLSALWALECGIEPPFHTATHCDLGNRNYSEISHIRWETKIVHKEEILFYKGCGVTTPLRTALDLLRIKDIKEEILKVNLQCLSDMYQITHDQINDELASRNGLPYKKRASQRMKDLYYPSETR